MADFIELTEFLDNVSSRFGIPGCDCAVTIDGRMVYRHSAGYKNEKTKEVVSSSDTYWIYSCTKLCTCTAALQLIEKGTLALDAPVSRYLPEFSALTVRGTDGIIHPSKEVLTIRHLMTMTGGLDYDLNRPGLRRMLNSGARSTREIVAALAEDPLRFEPGSHFLYSLCHDVLGAVIEQVSGLSLAEYIKRSITDPLGMVDTTFHPTAAQMERMATQHAHLDEKGSHRPIGQNNHFRFTEEYDSGGAGLLSTVDDYIRLVTALALGGTSEKGIRILSEDSVNLMKTAALGPVQRRDFLNRSPAAKGYSYGLGVRVMVEEIGTGVPAGEFGWDGAAGAYALADNTNRVAMFYAQQVCNSRVTFQEIHPALRDILYRCIKRR